MLANIAGVMSPALRVLASSLKLAAVTQLLDATEIRTAIDHYRRAIVPNHYLYLLVPCHIPNP